MLSLLEIFNVAKWVAIPNISISLALKSVGTETFRVDDKSITASIESKGLAYMEYLYIYITR